MEGAVVELSWTITLAVVILLLPQRLLLVLVLLACHRAQVGPQLII